MSSASVRPLLRVGDRVRVCGADYLYGLGELTIRVTAVGADLARYPRLEWVRLRGVEIRPGGAEGDTRDVLVRVAALRVPGAVNRGPDPGPATHEPDPPH